MGRGTDKPSSGPCALRALAHRPCTSRPETSTAPRPPPLLLFLSVGVRAPQPVREVAQSASRSQSRWTDAVAIGFHANVTLSTP